MSRCADVNTAAIAAIMSLGCRSRRQRKSSIHIAATTQALRGAAFVEDQQYACFSVRQFQARNDDQATRGYRCSSKAGASRVRQILRGTDRSTPLRLQVLPDTCAGLGAKSIVKPT